MKKLVLAFLTITASAPAWASGCGSYDYFRTITESRDEGGLGETEFVVLSADRQSAKIQRTAGELTLEYETEYYYYPRTDSNLTRLHKRDVKFSEGNGCGPVYDCLTGQFVLKIPDPAAKMMRVYSYPRIDEFQFYPTGHERIVWKARSVIPPMLGLTIEGEPADLKQCMWGSW